MGMCFPTIHRLKRRFRSAAALKEIIAILLKYWMESVILTILSEGALYVKCQFLKIVKLIEKIGKS